MKSRKINLSLIVLAIIVEIVSVHLLNSLGNCELLAYTLSSFFLFIIFILLLTNQKSSNNLLIRLILNMKGEAGSWFGVFSVMFVFFNLNWISVQIFELWKIDNQFFQNHSVVALSVIKIPFFLFYTINVLFIPSIGLYSDQRTEKLLICGLSTPTNSKAPENVINDLSSYYKLPATENCYIQLDDPSKEIRWGKWDVIRKSLEMHQSISEILLIISPQVLEFNKMIERLKNTENHQLYMDYSISQLINRFYGDRKIQISYITVEDVNSFERTKTTIGAKLEENHYQKYMDSEILFNLTGSTAIVSSVMTLFAMKGERKAEYVDQNTGKLVSINIDVLSVQDLWDEIMLKMQEKQLPKRS